LITCTAAFAGEGLKQREEDGRLCREAVALCGKLTELCWQTVGLCGEAVDLCGAGDVGEEMLAALVYNRYFLSVTCRYFLSVEARGSGCFPNPYR
jgi:hypothetical protein